MVKGPLELPATPVTAPGITPPIGEPVYLGPKFVGEPSIPINIPGLPKVNFGPITSQAQFRSAMSAYLTSVYEKETKRIIEQYQASVAVLASTLQKELDTARGGTYAGDSNSVGVLFREINLRESAVNQKTIQRQTQQTKANSFYSADFSSKGRVDFIRTVTDLASRGKAAVIVIPRWQESLAATYQARYLGDQIALLNAQTVTLREQLAVAQARLAAEAEAARIKAEAEAKRVAEVAAYKDAVSFLAATNEKILQKYGANMSKIAQELQANISGKKVRSYTEAMATFEKVKANPNIKLNAKDTQAVVDALNVLDKATFADNVSRLGKAFGVVGTIVQADTIREKAVSGFQTGDWKPLMLEFEAMAVGTLAATAAGAMLAAVLGVLSTPAVIAVPFVAVLMAGVASYIDAEKVDGLNGLIAK